MKSYFSPLYDGSLLQGCCICRGEGVPPVVVVRLRVEILVPSCVPGRGSDVGCITVSPIHACGLSLPFFFFSLLF